MIEYVRSTFRTLALVLLLALAGCGTASPERIEPTNRSQQPAEIEAHTSDSPAWPPLAESDFFQTLMADSTPVVILLTSRYCAACPPIEAELAARRSHFEGIARIYQIELEETSPGFARRYYARGTPTLLVFINARVVDSGTVYSATDDFVSHLLFRNGLLPSGPATIDDLRPHQATLEIPAGGAVVAANLEGMDLSGRNLSGVSFAGCSARGADFTGTNLQEALFSRTDLTGAQLDAARLDQVIWLNTVCPDGTGSWEHTNTCIGHL